MGRVTIFGSFVMLVLAAVVAFVQPFELDSAAHFMLGGILITLCVWVFKPFGLSYAIGGLFMAFVALVLGLTPGVVFSGFTQNAVWTLIPALFFGFALQKTGLGRRIALGIIRVCGNSYVSIVFAWVLIGVALSLLTPATTVRVAIVIPIAVQCCSLLGLGKGSRGNALILLTAFGMALIPGSGWFTGVIWGPFIQGLMDAEPATAGLVTFGSWFGVMFVPVSVSAILLVLGSLVFLKPSEKLSPEAVAAIKTQQLEKVTRHEAIAAIILGLAFVLFVTTGLHGLSITIICLGACLAFFAFGVLEAKDFNAGVNWDLIVFVAMALSLGVIFTEMGISQWLAGIIVPALRPIAGNPWLFMFSITIFMFLWRFVDLAIFLPTIAIIVPILPAIQEAYGISPLVWLAVFIMAGNSFFLAYQNMWAMMSRSMAADRAWSNKHMAIYGALYFVACLVALAIAIPMWVNAGLFGGY
ncbi:MAG: SLC13 family permease [Defluviitaleaceae bacterium]|nr:SLC13 family permease [Defluviitaleaceae bacterium]